MKVKYSLDFFAALEPLGNWAMVPIMFFSAVAGVIVLVMIIVFICYIVRNQMKKSHRGERGTPEEQRHPVRFIGSPVGESSFSGAQDPKALWTIS